MTTEPRRGRPQIDSDLVKSESLLLRLSSAEKQGFADAAGLFGLPLTVWMRERLRRAATEELQGAARPVAFLAPPKTPVTTQEKPMRLADELKAYGISESPEDFRTRLINSFLNEFPGRSIDSVVCHPPDALNYCDKIRADINSDPADILILKTLMNIRRMNSCPTGLKSLKTRKTLKAKLKDVGCEIDKGAFRELVNDCLADMYHNRTIDEVLCHPREAAALCTYVRNRGKSSVLTDELILMTLMNNRKRGSESVI